MKDGEGGLLTATSCECRCRKPIWGVWIAFFGLFRSIAKMAQRQLRRTGYRDFAAWVLWMEEEKEGSVGEQVYRAPYATAARLLWLSEVAFGGGGL